MTGALLEQQFNQIIAFILANKDSNDDDDDEPKVKIQKNDLISDIISLDDNHKINVENSPSCEKFKELYFDKKTPVIIEGN